MERNTKVLSFLKYLFEALKVTNDYDMVLDVRNAAYAIQDLLIGMDNCREIARQARIIEIRATYKIGVIELDTPKSKGGRPSWKTRSYTKQVSSRKRKLSRWGT